MAALTTLSGSLMSPQVARAQCSSPNPANWPAPAKPYFLLIVDTSGSMVQCTNPLSPFPETCTAATPLNSCGLLPSRLNDAKCALRKTVQAFSGEVNFGLETFAPSLSACPAGACTNDCVPDRPGTCNLGSGMTAGCDCPGSVYFGEDYACTFNDVNGSCGFTANCAGAGPAAPNYAKGTWVNGGRIVEPIKLDSPVALDNTAAMLAWFDTSCNGSEEIFAEGGTPLQGSLQTAAQYLRAGWTPWSNTNYCNAGFAYQHASPVTGADPECRPLNIILVTDGDESCASTDPDPLVRAAFPAAVAADLYNNGVTIGAKNWTVKTYVINFAGGTTSATDAIAAAGGTGSSLLATNEVTLAQQLGAIISGSVSPESCDNQDNNCNGCVDEGYVHYCNSQPTCCAWTVLTDSNPAVPGERQYCLDQYTASIPGNPPDGNLDLLPCTTIAESQNDATGLCFNPGDTCDETDNNCDGTADEGSLKCGTPLHCPTAEICNVFPAEDDNCNGVTDEMCGGCVPSAEVCDGIDNNCVGGVDEGIAPIACGFSPPANCAGSRTCTGGSFGPCSNSPQTEVCDGFDNDCDTTVDDNVVFAPTTCVPPTHPGGLTYGGTSKCQLGTRECVSGMEQCQGGIGPDAVELCDGIDNNCNGQVDESPQGVGQPCGTNSPPCTPGTTVCTAGALVCGGGGVGPSPEICDGVDNNCNGQTDEQPLTDGPAPGFTGCWDLPGVACTHAGGPAGPTGDIFWSPPPGGSCTGLGSLTMPCAPGVLTCMGMSGWVCQGGNEPDPEVCDGVDNNCLNGIDEGTFPGEGATCGDNAPNPPDPPCTHGTIQCTAGFLECFGDTEPETEVCDGIDNNCNAQVDEGTQIGGACTPAYDVLAYPGNRNFGPGSQCQLGTFVCDPLGGGGQVCSGGVGPSPELCDGLDNDCDGTPDEAGTAPDGLDGTANPNSPPVANLGDTCGTAVGECSEGQWACLNGLFACLQGQGPVAEECDCNDNDCNGVVDNQPVTPPGPPLCGAGKQCVKSGQSCQCAAMCGAGEFPCPGGQACLDVASSELGTPLGKYCIADNCNDATGDCSVKTGVDAQGTILCTPEGTVLPNCAKAPECVCKNLDGCKPPCFGVSCTLPLVCTDYGPDAGTCVVNNCFNLSCLGCNEACNDLGECVPNPCPDPDCAPTEVCKPNADFTDASCFPTCAGVVCDAGTVCHDGVCVATCSPACPTGEYCDETQAPPVCLTSACDDQSCPNGGCCNPADGTCGSCPCEGVVCPDEQVCEDGECIPDSMGVGGGGTTSSSTSSTGGGGSAAQGSGGGEVDNSVFGLATGGGGCACSVPKGQNDGGLGWLGAGALVALVATRKRKRSLPGAQVGKEVSR